LPTDKKNESTILASTESSSAKDSYIVDIWYYKVFSPSEFVPLDKLMNTGAGSREN
jgi:hypothetical protein